MVIRKKKINIITLYIIYNNFLFLFKRKIFWELFLLNNKIKKNNIYSIKINHKKLYNLIEMNE